MAIVVRLGPLPVLRRRVDRIAELERIVGAAIDRRQRNKRGEADEVFDGYGRLIGTDMVGLTDGELSRTSESAPISFARGW